MSNEYISPKPLWNEKVKGDKTSNENSNNYAPDLINIQLSFNSKNRRGKTCLLSNEENISFSSDFQLCYILDMIIYEKSQKNIKLIFDNGFEGIRDFDSINIFFQLFGFTQSSEKDINNRQIFLKLLLPFLKEEKSKDYIVKRLNYNKSFYSWINAKFNREDFTKIKDFMEFKEINCLGENNIMNHDAFLFFNNTGASLNVKFTFAFIHEDEINAFDLGDINANNRIFVGLYRQGENIHFYIPLLSEKKKEKSVFKLKYTTDPQISKSLLLPNYGPIYLQQITKKLSIPYFQIFVADKYKISETEVDNFKSFLNNDFPLFINCYQKEPKPIQTSYPNSKLLFQIQNLLLYDEKVRIANFSEKFNDIIKILCENIFQIPKDSFVEGSDGIEINSGSNLINFKGKKEEEFFLNNQYLLHLMTPNNFIPIVPYAKISSPFELVDITVNSFSNIFFIAKSQKTKANKINIFFGSSDFGSSNLADNFWPEIIKTDELISTFIISCDIIFTEKDICCLPPGIIILHKKDSDKMITHYSKTKHIWKKVKEFKVSDDIKDKASVFFYSSKYIILYKNDNGRFEGKSYSFVSSKKTEKVKIKRADSKKDDDTDADADAGKEHHGDDDDLEEHPEAGDDKKAEEKAEEIQLNNDDLDSVYFTNNQIYFVKKDKSIVDYKSLIHNEKETKNKKETKNEVETNRIKDLLALDIEIKNKKETKNEEEIKNKKETKNEEEIINKKLDLVVSETNKDEFKNIPFPIAIEINQKLHALKVNDKKIESILYHPANKNSMLLYSILNMFYRYRRHFIHEYTGNNEQGTYIIHTSIDCSYNGDFNSIFKSSSSPGIYANFVKDEENKNISYGKRWTKLPNIVYLYFHNGKMQTGLTERRTLCQLAAAFACSYAISVYTSTGKVVCYEPPYQNAVIWTKERCYTMEKNLVATYGTLLEMKNDYEFEFALSVLEPTKNLISDFKNFLKSVSTQ